MGYDLHWKVTPYEVERARKAYRTTWGTDTPLEERERLSRLYWDAIDRGPSWFRISYSGFSNFASRMESAGILLWTPGTTFDNHPLGPWPECDVDPDDEDAYTSWRKSMEPYLRYRPEGTRGIPRWKFNGSDGFIVTPEEVIELYHQLPDSCQFPDWMGQQRWDEWRRFLWGSVGAGGFTVD